ncbi:MAG: fibronectin type III domain-containing protein [Treponema sp.]|jgi:hypothetical protein|nr:fibronectin type III domain-containing protein [Treponema sp.]
MKKSELTKQVVFPLFFGLLFAACDNGVILNSSNPPEAVFYPPSGVAIKALSPSRIKISWSPVPAAVQYNIYRGPSAGSTSFLTPVTPPLHAYEDTGLSSGSYYYEVSAEDADGNELTSTYYPVTTLPKLKTPVPRGSVQSPVSIRLDWDAVPDAASYKIYKASAPSADPPPASGSLVNTIAAPPLQPAGYSYYDVAPTGTYYNDTTSYYYWVKAIGPPDSDEGSLPQIEGVIRGIRNDKAADSLTVTTTSYLVTGGLPQTLPSGVIKYYFFDTPPTPPSVTYQITFSGLNSSDGVRFSVYLETSGGQQQILNIIDAGGPGPGRSYTFTPAAAGVVLISSDGRTNFGNFSIVKL